MRWMLQQNSDFSRFSQFPKCTCDAFALDTFVVVNFTPFLCVVLPVTTADVISGNVFFPSARLPYPNATRYSAIIFSSTAIMCRYFWIHRMKAKIRKKKLLMFCSMLCKLVEFNIEIVIFGIGHSTTLTTLTSVAICNWYFHGPYEST